MNEVIIYKLENNGEQTEFASFVLLDGQVSAAGDAQFVKYIKENGILDYSAKSGTKLFPTDGIKFLQNLKFNFNSGYFNAKELP